MSYQTLALISAIFFALTTISAKYISKHQVKDFNSFFFWTYISGLPFVIFIPIIFGLNFKLIILPSIIIHSILLTTGQYLFSKGIYLVDASVISPLFQLQGGFVLILATLFLGERYKLIVYSYLILLIIGAMLVSITDRTKIKGFFQKGVLFIIGMQVFHAGANIAIGSTLKYISSWQSLFYSFVFNSILVAIFTYIKKEKVTYNIKKISWMIVRVFFLLIATGLIYKAFETNISISTSLALLSSPIAFVLILFCSIFFPNLLEKHSFKIYLIRALGILLIMYGAWKIVILK